jgi:hypothetical protein
MAFVMVDCCVIMQLLCVATSSSYVGAHDLLIGEYYSALE